MTRGLKLLVVASCFMLLLGAGCDMPSKEEQQADAKQFTHMLNEHGQYKVIADQFVELARAGDADGMLAMMSAGEVGYSGRERILTTSKTMVIPFFQAAGKTEIITISGAKDAFGNTGYSFYGFSSDADGKNRKPYTVYVVRENGKLVVASASVNQFIKGRHG